MSETRLTNAQIDLEVFNAYSVEPSIYRSRFFKSGALADNPQMSAMLGGNGESYTMPFWKDTAGSTGDVPQEGTDQTVNALTSGKSLFRKQVRTKAWGSNDLVPVFSGSDPISAATGLVMPYWSQAFDQLAIKSIIGVLVDNASNDSGDLINDVSGGTGTASYFSDNAVIDAQALLGENGVVGNADTRDFAAILVHPATYAYMRKLDLIDFDVVSAQTRQMGTYMSMDVIVDRNAPLASTVYSSILLKPGALQFGLTSQGYLPTELDRSPLDGFGIDKLITRRAFAIHPVGFSVLETGIAGITPTDAELILAATWNRVFLAENSPIVSVAHKLP
jgi:hypothetical protein